MAWLLCALLSFGSRAETAVVNPNPEPIVDSYFGMHIHRADTVTRWPAARFGSWRLWDTYTGWLNLEPEKGAWQWARLDNLVSIAERENVELVLTFGSTPRWASARPDEPYFYAPGGAAEPRELSDWDNYVRTVVRRYRGRIRYYELWNEPSFTDMQPYRTGFFSGSIKDMVALARVAYRAVKDEDSAAQVLSPALYEEQGVARLDRYLGAGGAQYLDIVSHHFYRAVPEEIPQLVDRLRGVMAKHGLSGLELWNTETGYLIQNGGQEVKPASKTGYGAAVHSDADAAALLARQLVLGAASGVNRFFWYAWDNPTMGLISAKDGAPNAAAFAYTQVRRWLLGARIKGCISVDASLWTCPLDRGGRAAWIVWDVNAQRRWVPPQSWHAVEYEPPSGAVTATDKSGVPIGPSPVLVKSDRNLWSAKRP